MEVKSLIHSHPLIPPLPAYPSATFHAPFPENRWTLDSFSVHISLRTGHSEDAVPPRGNVVTLLHLLFFSYLFRLKIFIVFFLNAFPVSWLAVPGNASGAGGVDAKLNVVLESVKLVFPTGWVISSFQYSYTYFHLVVCLFLVILTNSTLPFQNSNSRMLA